MMKLLSIFGAQPEPGKTAAATTAEGDGAFASIMAFLRSDAGTVSDGENSDVAEILAEAEEALADPDLTDADLEAILAPMLEDLAAAVAAAPEQMARLRAALGQVALGGSSDAAEATVEATSNGEAPAEPALSEDGLTAKASQATPVARREAGQGAVTESDATGVTEAIQTTRAQAVATGQAVPLAGLRADPGATDGDWRALAEALPALRAALEGDETQLARQVASEPGVQALAARVLGMAEEIAQPARGAQLSDLVLSNGNSDEAAALDSAAFESADTPVTMTQRALQPQTVPLVQAASSATSDAPQSGQQIQVALVAPAAGTSEAAPLLQTEAPRLAQMPAAPSSEQILNQVRASVSDSGSIRVALTPEGLGALEIDLVPDDSGQLKVTVRAEQASVLSALRADREGLLTMLRDAGHQVDGKSLSFSDLGARDSGQGQTQGQAGQTKATFGFAGETAAAEPEMEVKQVVLPLSGGVDIQV